MMRILATAVISSLLIGGTALPASAQIECGASMSNKANVTPSAKCLVEKASLTNAPVGTNAAKAAASNPLTSVTRSQAFVANYRKATTKGSPTLILLHGSGGNETSLMDLAAKVAPGSALLGIRGRVVQDGINRWYKRVTPTTFDQDDIRSEANAFAKFMTTAQKDYGIDLNNAIYLGYSNGANLLAALSFLHPDLVQRAALLRPMMVLKTLPDVNLAKDSILAVAGKNDATYGSFAPGLADALRGKGAEVVGKTVELGHLLGDADVSAVKTWLASLQEEQQAPAATTLAASAE
ncbi:alpha/beta hydrolase [Tianweitania sp.]|uniref:alpha/beta hydrolase n=1 Tax=Tianweitania sp. TaxID=2021634 RepID=UPI0028988816|nr:alpha/beta hydrolase [Tianweitania sp.]